MGKGTGFVYLATAVLLFLAVLCGVASMETEEVYFRAELTVDGKTETIEGWAAEDGALTFFLPSFGSLDQLVFRTNAPGRFVLDGTAVYDGASCEGFEPDTDYLFLDKTTGESNTLTFVASGGVPTLYIDVASGSMDYIHAERGNEEVGSYRLYTAEGMQVFSGSLNSVKGRGNASWWGHDKKPYSLTLAAEANLLGMGKAQKWILLANSMEATNIKNKAVMDFARNAGLSCTADCSWVDLYLNGVYSGLYLLCERNEIHAERVDIPRENTFLVSMELESRLIKREYPYVKTQAQQALRIHQQYMQTEQVQSMWQSAENAILAPDSVDPVTGKHLSELIDLDSWTRKYLLEELFANVDACSISQFFYADGSGKIYAGPAWDYDGAMGNGVPESFYGNRFQACEGKPLPWFSTLYEKDFFLDRVKQLYAQEFKPLAQTLLAEDLDAYADRIAQAGAANSRRWASEDMHLKLDGVKAFMYARLAFLDRVWLEEEPHHMVYVDMGTDMNGVNYVVRPGECLPQLPVFTDTPTTRDLGWHVMGTEEPFDPSLPIHENTAIYRKFVPVEQLPEEEYRLEEEPWDEPEGQSAGRLAPMAALLFLFGGLMLTELFRMTRKKKV